MPILNFWAPSQEPGVSCVRLSSTQLLLIAPVVADTSGKSWERIVQICAQLVVNGVWDRSMQKRLLQCSALCGPKAP